MFATKVANFGYFCKCLLFDEFYHNHRFWMEIVLHINFYHGFLIYASHFAAFFDHAKDDGDVSINDGNYRLIFIFSENTCLRLLSHQIWLLYILPVNR